MNKKKYIFQSLKPVSNAELNIYSDALGFAMTTPNITNIAISGSYGSGKSSILETYKAKDEKAKFIHISFAHFDKDDEVEQLLNPSLKNIEGKIINQLVHQIDPVCIPLIDYKTKENLQTSLCFKTCIATAAFVIALLHIIMFTSWQNIVNSLSIPFLKDFLSWSAHYDSMFISGGICLATLVLGIFHLLKTQKHRKMLRKISFQGKEFELFSDDDDSLFDKHLNEILYLLENCGVDNIVFEDIDRFDNNRIFEKLREINTIINNRFPKRKTPLRFLYLIRDDIFNNKDRTKFFDYIIPIVPVINGSNSIEQFLKIFKEAGIVNQFSEVFLSELSLYVDDMRILKNICNEYIIYSEQISEIELDKDKLLAILVYKNLFPKDFINLQLRKGYVFNLFEQRYTFCDALIEETSTRIKESEDLITAANREKFDDIDELDALMLAMNLQITKIDGSAVNNDISHIDLIKQIKKSPGKVMCQKIGYSYPMQFNVEEELSKLADKPDYIKRKAIIEAKGAEKVNSLKVEINELKQQLQILKNNKLKDIIPMVNEDRVFSVSYSNIYVENSNDLFEDVKKNPYHPMIIYLVKNGYIDESYLDYMTYFYSESITANDKNFLISIAEKKKKEYTYTLDKPERVLARLYPISFSHIETLNYDLIDALLGEKKSHIEHVSTFIRQLRETRNFEFIVEYWTNGRENAEFIRTLNHYWPEVFTYILNESSFTDDQKHMYAVDTLYFSSKEELKKVNKNNSLVDYINNKEKFLDIKDAGISKLIEGFKLLGVKFISLNYDSSNIKLFNEVYKNNMYLLSCKNTISILRNIYGEEGDDLTIIQNFFTLIGKKQEEPLYKYVEVNISKYFSNLLDSCENKITDTEETAIRVLNHKNIVEIASKERYISYLVTNIFSITSIENMELWSCLLDSQVVEKSDANIIDYYFHFDNEIDDSLLEFINAQIPNPCDFDKSKIDDSYGERSAAKFFTSIVGCNSIKNEQYKTIVDNIDIKFSTFSIPDIDIDKISILIDLLIIPMSDDAVVFMRNTYEEEFIHYIVKNIDDFVYNVFNDGCLELNEVLALLDEPISDANKLEIICYTKEEISIQNKKYSNELIEYIIENNYDNDDLSYLIKNFATYSETLQRICVSICIDNIDSVIALGHSIDFNLYKTLIQSSNLEINNKLSLFSMQIIKLKINDVVESLSIMSLSKYCGLFERKQIVVTNNNQNIRILEIFKKRGWKFIARRETENTLRIYGKLLKK